MDFGATSVSGMHVTCVAALREHYGLKRRPVRVIDPQTLLGEIDEELKRAIGIDTEGVFRRTTKYGFPAESWKTWRLHNGLEVLVPGGFNLTVDADGNNWMHPRGDIAAQPTARMPAGGWFFDNVDRVSEVREDHPEDNLAEFGAISGVDLDALEQSARAARATGRAVVANIGGMSLGDVNNVPAPALAEVRGIRDVTEWYVSTRSRRRYIHAVFEGQVEIAIRNLEQLAARMSDLLDVVNVCSTDFGTQTSSFCSVDSFRELWLPYYQRMNGWIHSNTPWKTFKHSCGAVAKFIPAFIEAGFDILNPVQCSAAGMDPEGLKREYGSAITFWGGGVDTQHVLPFGTPEQVREQVLRRLDVFASGGGYVFNAIHNVQAETPVANVVAMVEAVREFSPLH